MKIIVCVFVSLLLTINCFSEVKLWHYTDRATSEERGICYSDEKGNPAITNPDWDMEIISERDKQSYLNLQQQQAETKDEQARQEKKDKAKRVKDKLKDLGISEGDLDAVIN